MTGYATGINHTGQISGTTQNYAGFSHATGWSGAGRGDLGMVDNPSGTGALSYANGINDAGRVVGSGQTADYYRHATLWKAPNEMKDLAGGDSLIRSDATANNNSGQTVGWTNTSLNDSPRRALLWNSSTTVIPTVLNSLGGAVAYATAINDAGIVVGKSQVSGTTYRAVRWNGTAPTDLGTFGGSSSYATAINAAGQIVGQSQIAGNAASHAVIWDGDAAIDLNALVDPSVLAAGWVLERANDINDLGWIVGSARNTVLGYTHAFRLEHIAGPPHPADFDGDGHVDGDALALWTVGFGTTENATRSQGDANADGSVDGADFLTWQRELSLAANPLSGAPEPAVNVLISMAALASFSLGRRSR